MRSTSPTESSYSSKAADPSTRAAPRLPFEVPEFISRNVIDVTSPADIVDVSECVRGRKLRRLHQKYFHQIQHGCKNPKCTTPTCLSFRRRQTRAPLRLYTDLSAKALAYHLLSERDPEAALCRYEPAEVVNRSNEWKAKASQYGRKSPSLPKVDVWQDLGNTQPLRERQHSNNMLPNGQAQQPGSPKAQVERRGSREPLQEQTQLPIRPASKEDLQPKDPKSFTQTLFRQTVFSLIGMQPWRLGFSYLPQPDSKRHQGKSGGSTETNHESWAREASSYGKPPCSLQRSYDCPRTEDAPEEFMTGNSESEYPEETHPTQLANHKPAVDRWPTTSPLSNASEPCPLTAETGAPSHSDLENLEPNTAASTASSDQSVLERAKSPPVLMGEPNTEIPPELTLSFLSKNACRWFFQANSAIFTDYASVLGKPWDPQQFERLSAKHPHRDCIIHFVRQSVFYGLKDIGRLIKMVADWHARPEESVEMSDGDMVEHEVMWELLAHVARLANSGRLYEYLFDALQPGFVPPVALGTSHRGSSLQKRNKSQAGPWAADSPGGMSRIDDNKLAFACAFALTALAYHVWPYRVRPLRDQFSVFEESTLCFPAYFVERQRLYASGPGDFLQIADGFEDWYTHRLFKRIMELVQTRITFAEVSKACRPTNLVLEAHAKNPSFAELIVAHLRQSKSTSDGGEEFCNVPAVLTIAWCRHLFSKSWNGNAVIRRTSPIGGSLQLLAAMYQHRHMLQLEPANFYINVIADKLNTMEMPVEWLTFRQNNKELHLLSYSFLFKPSTLVEYFRAINFSVMAKSNVGAQVVHRDVKNFLDGYPIPAYGIAEMLQVIRPHMALHLVLTVRRDNLLTDAINQVWRRRRAELMRPLKVLMGQDEGEQGIDHGGVQQEFFRILFAEALDPAYGMFTVDDVTRMTWFQPGSFEPLYKFEMLGVLMSVAIYNSITLPITFPLAFYRKVLGLKVKKLAHIEDGWPVLAKGLQQMLSWTDGDVGDVFVRTYQFGYDHFGSPVEIDMEKIGRDSTWPPFRPRKGKEREKMTSFELPLSPELTPLEGLSPPSSPDVRLSPEATVKGTSTPSSVQSDEAGASLVINANREQYIKDYIFWLADKSIRPQFEAFAKGFYVCLDRAALSIFTPEALKLVIEGHQEIDIDGLQQTTQYEDGFEKDSPLIQDFWQIVRNFSREQHQQLLEFVTASDRVPVNGISSIPFIIQKNGSDDSRLPTSMTCFSRLLLPEYSSREILEEKLARAIAHSKGFGVA